MDWSGVEVVAKMMWVLEKVEVGKVADSRYLYSRGVELESRL